MLLSVAVIATLFTMAGLNQGKKQAKGIPACNDIADVSIGALSGPNDIEMATLCNLFIN